jgi:hypothetical protein
MEQRPVVYRQLPMFVNAQDEGTSSMTMIQTLLLIAVAVLAAIILIRFSRRSPFSG